MENSRRPLWALFFVLFISSLIACTMPSPRKQNREDRLRENLRSFHWALIGQDVANALRFAPPDERDAWDEAFYCIFKRLRLLDYRVELIDFRKENKEATVRVRWTSHPLDSLVVDETLWKEEWSFNPMKQRWTVLPDAGKLKGFPEDCLPDPPEGEGSPESPQ